MSPCNKGQIEIEAIFAIVFSLVILTLVLVYVDQQAQEIKNIEKLDKKKNECSKISSFISLIKKRHSLTFVPTFKKNAKSTIIGVQTYHEPII